MMAQVRAEVLDLVRDHGPAFATRGLEDDPVAAPGQVLAVGDGGHVVAGPTGSMSEERRPVSVEAISWALVVARFGLATALSGAVGVRRRAVLAPGAVQTVRPEATCRLAVTA
jgi:hypothetical protein